MAVRNYRLYADNPKTPWLLSLRGPKDEELNARIKVHPGVAWDQHGKRWLVPVEVARAHLAWEALMPEDSAPLRIWARKASPIEAVFSGRHLTVEGDKFCNPNSQRTQRLIQELDLAPGDPLIITSVDMLSDLKKAFSLLELVYPGRFGRWPDRYSGSWRFLERYSNYDESRFGRIWGGILPEGKAEYLSRLRCCAYIDEPVAEEVAGPVEAKGLFE